jgi:hypothetical protein
MKPGLASQTLRELAPLLAEEGIDVDNIDVPDLATLQAALNRAVGRHYLARFIPVGEARDWAVTGALLPDETAYPLRPGLPALVTERWDSGRWQNYGAGAFLAGLNTIGRPASGRRGLWPTSTDVAGGQPHRHHDHAPHAVG